MKRLALAVVAFGLAAGGAAADPAAGVWQTQPDDGAYAHVTIAPCGNKLCGVISRTFKGSAEYDSPNKGKQLVMGMTPQGNGKYTGKVWRPSNGKVYNGKMEVSGKTLKMSGCIAGGLLCSSQTWTKLR